MRLALCFLSLSGFMEIYLPAATIQFQVTPIVNGSAQNQFRYNYFVSDIAFAANQELNIQFDFNMFGALSDGKAGSGFDLLLFQPNDPPQAPGEYSALAIVDQPSLTGPFSVDVTFTGSGVPGSQAFFINQFANDGTFQRVITSGATTPLSNNTVPEPTTISFCCLCFLLAGARLAARRKQCC